MAYFALPYRILFHDSMAYGSHHFLTNFKFQCEAREHLLFGEVPQHASPESLQYDRYIFLTQQGYARTLAPAFVGARVAILLTLEESSASSVRFCFRVIGEDGVPVCCGYQTVVCLSRETKQVVPAPEAMRTLENTLRERLAYPSFADRIQSGDLHGIFDDETCALGKRLANAPVAEAYPRIVLRPEERNPEPRLDGGNVFLYPGQGSYNRTLLRELRNDDGGSVREVDELTRAILGASLLELLDAADHEHDTLVRDRWPLTQVAMYLTGVLATRRLLDQGTTPSAFVGHSVGEMAALAAAGAYDLLTGAEIVCRRAMALATAAAKGGMLALSTAPERVSHLLKVLAPSSLHLAVVNHARQSIVSGLDDDLVRLAAMAASIGVTAQRVATPYPFHSPMLNAARAAFAGSLKPIPIGHLTHPVYTAMGKGWYAEGQDLARILPGHFVGQLDFAAAVSTLERLGARSFIDCGGGSFLRGILERALAQPAAATIESATSILAASRTPRAMPRVEPVRIEAAASSSSMDVAVVSLACVLPGASDVAAFWEMIRHGAHAIVDIGEVSPESKEDFLVAGGGPDKTYSLLGGIIENEQITFPDGVTIPASWSFTQRLLAACLLQCRAGVARERRPMQFLVGSTADGMSEVDEALLQAELDRIAGALGSAASGIRPLLEGITRRDPKLLAGDGPGRAWQAVARTLLGENVETYAVDAACASSLYSIALSVLALRAGRCDFAYAGGVFAPGPVNNCLFSQFRGLSPTGSRPFDAGADGVVFSSGAAMVALKRLPDAIADGERIHAIIRGIGLSSDGASASVTEPKLIGQRLAMQRAYASAGIAPGSVQYVEAHATSTPVGDGVELGAIQEVFEAGDGPLVVGSVKALIGHAGWAAGAASVVKVCSAFAAETLPRQPYFSHAGAALRPSTRVTIPTVERPWTRATGPRRAGVNSFGFGGTNAHLVLEEFVPGARGESAPAPLDAKSPLVVIGCGALFPWSSGEVPDGRSRVDDARLTMAGIRRVMPEVEEEMDRDQRLAVSAAQLALESMAAETRKKLSDEIGLVLGLEGKTDKSIAAIRRVHADSVARRLRKRWSETGKAIPEAELNAETNRLVEELRRGRPSNAYSLPGLMPNVVAGRVANLLNLRGPNFIIDAGSDSFRAALQFADDLLRQRLCSIVLAGGIGAAVGSSASLLYDNRGRTLAEAAFLLAITSAELAEREGLQVLARISLETDEAVPDRSAEPYLAGAEGSWETAQAFDTFRRKGTTSTASIGSGVVRFSTPAGAAVDIAPEPESLVGDVQLTTPVWQMLPALSTSAAPPRSILLLVDEPDDAAFSANGARVVVRSVRDVDLTDDASARAALQDIDPSAFDLVLAFKGLGTNFAAPADAQPLLELLFATTRHFYDRFANGQTALAALTTSPAQDERPQPITGLFGGFLKSLARELPNARCRAVHTDAPAGPEALRQVLAELERESRAIEVFYRRGIPGQLVLQELPHAARPGTPAVADGHVVLATGGGRGVTAALCEELLARARCKVVMVGRSDPDAIAPNVRAMSEDALASYEAEFYRLEIGRTPGARPAELRTRFRGIRETREVASSIDRLRAAGHAVEYRRVDVTDADAVDALVGGIVRDHGRLDLVMHGAAAQVSRRTDLKSLADFRRIVSVKVQGFENLRGAAERHGVRPAFHLLTSAFSFFGNDGQPDYGAANEALGRVAASESNVTAIAWLGWAGIGMTSGSEYEALARARRLRPLAREEGRKIYGALAAGTPTAANNVLISPGEKAFYGIAVLPPPRIDETMEWRITAAREPFILDHRVHGTPTLPGTFELEFAIRSAARLCPGRNLVGVEEVRFERFVKVSGARERVLKAPARVVYEDDRETVVRVELRSDFTHDSGAVLQRDVLHFSTFVRFSAEAHPLPKPQLTYDGSDGERVADPYVDSNSPVWLQGPFRCLLDVRLNGNERMGRFGVEHARQFAPFDRFAIPVLLLDCLCRFAMIERTVDGNVPLFVPAYCRRVLIRPGVNDAALEGRPVVLKACTPRRDPNQNLIRNARAEAVGPDGETLLIVEDLTAQQMRPTGGL